jgi:predicted nuclease with TOPRIM domain
MIDLENRFYNYKLRNIKYKPIEKIILSNNNFSKEEIGNIYLWIDIEELEKEKEDLEKKPKLIEDEEKKIKINLDNLPNPIKLNNINLIKDNNNFQIRCMVYDIEYIDAINSVNKSKNDLFIISKI